MEAAGGGFPEDSGMAGATVLEICATTAVPAVAMALGSAAVSMAEPSEALEARLQRFSAGLLVGAVVTEIFPILKANLVRDGRLSLVNMVAAVLGFTIALLLMYSIKAMDLDEGDSDDDEQAQGTSAKGGSPSSGPLAQAEWHQPKADGDEEAALKLKMWLTRLQAHAAALGRLVQAQEVDRDAVDEEVHGIDFLVDSARRLCKGAEPMDRRSTTRLRKIVVDLIEDVGGLRELDPGEVSAIQKRLRAANGTLLKVHSVVERATFRRWGPRPLPEPVEAEDDGTGKVPTGLVIAVVVDAAIDGMLIGLAGAVSATSGRLMATATTFEMGFLGYSFACSILKAVRGCTSVALLALPPLAMLGASVLAGESVSFLQRTPAFTGFIAFAMVALLFLVFQELLVEAHEKEGGEAWHISLWLYAGLLVSMYFDLLL